MREGKTKDVCRLMDPRSEILEEVFFFLSPFPILYEKKKGNNSFLRVLLMAGGKKKDRERKSREIISVDDVVLRTE